MKFSIATLNKCKGTIFLGLSFFVFILSSLFYIFSASKYIRFYADDFCTAGVLEKYGYFNAQTYWYEVWSGRFSFNALVHFFELFGIGMVHITPFLILLTLSFSVFFIFSFLIEGKTKNLLLAISFFLILISLYKSPNIIQTLFWQTGSLTYMIPFVFLFIIFGYFLRAFFNEDYFNKKRKKLLLILFLLSFIGGGFSESYVALQITFIIFSASLFFLLDYKKVLAQKFLYIYGVLGSIMSMIFIISAPGNIKRKNLLPPTDPTFEILLNTFKGTLLYFQDIFLNKSFIAVLAVVFIIFLLFFSSISQRLILSTQKIVLLVGYNILGAFILVASVFAPAYYGLGYSPPARTLYLSHFILLFLVVLCAFVVSHSKKAIALKKSLFVYLFCGVLLLLISYKLKDFYRPVIADLKIYSEAFDKKQKAIRESNHDSKIFVPKVPSIADFEVITSDPENWVNGCVALYYKVKDVATEGE